MPVPFVNPELFENTGVAHPSPIPSFDVQSAARASWRPLVFVPGTRRSSIRKPGPPPPDRCPPALSQEATEAHRGRPHSVGVTMRRLERLAICFRDRQAGNGRRLASERLSPFLDMADPTRPAAPAEATGALQKAEQRSRFARGTIVFDSHRQLLLKVAGLSVKAGA